MSNYKDLIERCKEICAWQDTGLLKGDALRNFAASRPYAQQHNAVSIAQAETLREVADAFIASVDRIAELESSLAATSDMVNKAFADGKAEGHGDATAEASVVIGELRARVAELEAERCVPRARIEWTIEGKSGHGEWFPSHSRATLVDYCKVMNEQYGMGSHCVVDEPAKQLLTPEQIEKADEAIREALGDASDCMRVWDAWSYGTMGPDDFWPVAESDERVAEIRNATAVALGFKVDNQ